MAFLLLLFLGAKTFALPPLLSLSEVYPGMAVEGKTVLYGTELTTFQGKVIDILPQAIGTMSLVLAELQGAGLEETGVIAGMSGSPVYVGEKLLGAISYGWSFSKKPIAGITPAEEMAELLPQHQGRAFQEWAASPFLLDSYLAPSHLSLETYLRPLFVPLSVSGLSKEVLDRFQEKLHALRLEPFTAPASRHYSETSFPLKGGSPVGIPLIAGDIDFTAMGTVTFCEASYCAAFGHPFLELDFVPLPATGGYIHTVIPTISSSFKIGSRGKIEGAVVRDRQEGILIEKGASAPFVPAEFSVEGKKLKLFLAHLPPFFSLLYGIALLEAIFDKTGLIANMTVHLKLKVKAKEGEFLLEDAFYSPYGLEVSLLSRLEKMMTNPFGTFSVERLETEVHVERERKTAELLQFSLPKKTYKPGEEVAINVAFSVYPGKVEWRTYRFSLPRLVPQKQVEIALLSGSLVKSKSKVLPTNYEQWNRYYSDWYQSSDLVVVLSTKGREVGLSGEPLPFLPETILGILSESESVQGYVYKDFSPYVFSTPYILSGKLGGIIFVEDK